MIAMSLLVAAEETVDETQSHSGSPRGLRAPVRLHRLDHHLRPAVVEGRPADREGACAAGPSASRASSTAPPPSWRRPSARRPTIRQAVGDIGAERARLLAEADVHAEALLTDGRARLDAEIADLHAKADADIAALANRGGDELRSEIGHVAAAAADRVVEQTIDAETQQRLIEDFISRVGAGATP